MEEERSESRKSFREELILELSFEDERILLGGKFMGVSGIVECIRS